jgi:hypothetical protein
MHVPTMIHEGASCIAEPEFPLPQFPMPEDSYLYRTAAMTHVRMGKIEIDTPPWGKALIELFDRPPVGGPHKVAASDFCCKPGHAVLGTG